MNVDTSNIRANLIALQEALKGVDGENFASANVKDVSVTTNDAGLTITFNAVVDGVETPVVLSMTPELEPPEGTADEVAMGTLLEKINELDVSEMSSEEAVKFMQALLEKTVEKMQEKGMIQGAKDGAGLPQVTGGATLFNLLEVLSLIVKASQELKQAAKTIKAAENEQQAQAYEQQAKKTMAMAEAAKSMGSKYTAISAVFLAVSAVMSVGAGVVGAAKGFLSDTKASGTAAGMSKTVFSGGDQPDMTQVTTPDGLKAVKSLGDGGAVSANAIRDDFANSPKIAQAKTDYQTAVNQLEALPANDPGRPAAEANVATKKAEFIDAVMEVKGKYDSDYIAAPKETAAQKEAEMTIANEYAMKTLKGTQVDITRNGQQPAPESILSENDCAKIRNSCDRTYRTNLKEENHYVISAVGAGAMHLGQLFQVLNQHWQSEVSYEAQGKAAQAQEEQADATRKQKDYDESKSLEEAAQTVIDAARQTLQKTYESQREATREIFG